jgi:D-tyrosyl-tRNA(Tyr) deacylase
MRAVLQRVSSARVRVDGAVVGEIARGFLVLLGVGRGDGDAEVEYIAGKIHSVRVFPDDEGRMNRSIVDVGGAVLVVSQFTLYGDVRRGRRPSFIDAAEPVRANALYEAVVANLRGRGLTVATGVFQADMQVELVNDGPVTLILESPGAPPAP